MLVGGKAQNPVAQVKKAGRALEKAAVKRQTDRATERFDPISADVERAELSLRPD